MALPTTYDPASVTYVLVIEGDNGVPPQTTVALIPGNLNGNTRTEEFMAAYEAGLQALGAELLSVTDVSGVHINRSYQGAINATDIFVTP